MNSLINSFIYLIVYFQVSDVFSLQALEKAQKTWNSGEYVQWPLGEEAYSQLFLRGDSSVYTFTIIYEYIYFNGFISLLKLFLLLMRRPRMHICIESIWGVYGASDPYICHIYCVFDLT